MENGLNTFLPLLAQRNAAIGADLNHGNVWTTVIILR